MQIKTIRNVYFSATGTTKKIADTLSAELSAVLHAPVVTDDFTLPAAREKTLQFAPDELVVFGTPVYAGRVPNVLLPYLTQKIVGGGALAVPFVTFGNRNYDDGLIELQGILQNAGCHTVAAGAFAAEHSFSYVLGAHRPDAADLNVAKQLAKLAAERVQALTLAPEPPVKVKGETPLRPYYTPRDRAGNPVNILKVKPKTNEACTKCGLCAEVCPMGSISKEDPSQVVGICIKCGACFKKCPVGAKYYDDAGYLYHQHELEEGYARRAEPEIF